MNAIQKLVIEFRRRRVFRVAGIYVVGSWVVLQVAALAFQSLAIPDAALRWVWVALFAGFPLALLFGWRYDITASGIVRTAPAEADATFDLSLRASDRVILAALAIITLMVGLNLVTEIRGVQPDLSGNRTYTVVQPNSIAVLPLGNLSGDPEQEYFVSGMHEALIADLARISGLKVISRISTEQYQDGLKPASEIAAELGVAYLIKGSVLRADNQVRITVQLIDAANNEQVWAENYERELTNILRLQSNVARAIANQIKVKLTPYEDAEFSASYEVDPEAYELYLKGRFHWYKFTESDLQLALEYFELAIELDPDYPLAYVGFADALATPAHVGMMPSTQVFPAAARFVLRAIELDENLAEAHDMLARIQFTYQWDWDAADRGFRRAIGLKPGYPDVHIVYSQFLAITNRWDESLAEAKTGLELDPLNPWYRLELAERLSWFGQYDQARLRIDELIKSQPDWFAPYRSLWNTAYQQGEFEVAAKAAGTHYRLKGEPALAKQLESGDTGLTYHEMMRSAAELLRTKAERKYVDNVEFAELWMHAGDHEQALDYLEQAFQQHETRLVYTAAQPIFQPVRNSDRYQALLRNMNL